MEKTEKLKELYRSILGDTEKIIYLTRNIVNNAETVEESALLADTACDYAEKINRKNKYMGKLLDF